MVVAHLFGLTKSLWLKNSVKKRKLGFDTKIVSKNTRAALTLKERQNTTVTLILRKKRKLDFWH